MSLWQGNEQVCSPRTQKAVASKHLGWAGFQLTSLSLALPYQAFQMEPVFATFHQWDANGAQTPAGSHLSCEAVPARRQLQFTRALTAGAWLGHVSKGQVIWLWTQLSHGL